MKSYLVDEIEISDLRRIRAFLSDKAIPSGLDTVFWVKVPNSLLTPLQQEHLPCQPHVFAVETGMRFVRAELYMRTLGDMRCRCQGYCTPHQAHFVVEWVNRMLNDLLIGT